MNELILLVAEDLPEEVFILKRALERARFSAPVHFVRDGQEALDYFSGEGSFADRRQNPLPTLLLLDLKMPRLDGFQVLEWLRRQPGLRRLPVIVFTSSDVSQDIRRAYDLGANSYVVKPHASQDLESVASRLQSYWFQLNRHADLAPD
jgi:CheY-like chemotaxis protein